MLYVLLTDPVTQDANTEDRSEEVHNAVGLA